MKVKRNLPREHPQPLEGRILHLSPPAVTWSCTSQGCLPRQTGFIFTGMDVKFLYTSPSLHCCFLSLPSPSAAQEERQKGVCSLWRELQGSGGWQELFLWKKLFPGLSQWCLGLAVFKSFGCSPQAASTDPTQSRAQPKRWLSYSSALQGGVKGCDGTPACPLAPWVP